MDGSSQAWLGDASLSRGCSLGMRRKRVNSSVRASWISEGSLCPFPVTTGSGDCARCALAALLRASAASITFSRPLVAPDSISGFQRSSTNARATTHTASTIAIREYTPFSCQRIDLKYYRSLEIGVEMWKVRADWQDLSEVAAMHRFCGIGCRRSRMRRAAPPLRSRFRLRECRAGGQRQARGVARGRWRALSVRSRRG